MLHDLAGVLSRCMVTVHPLFSFLHVFPYVPVDGRRVLSDLQAAREEKHSHVSSLLSFVLLPFEVTLTLFYSGPEKIDLPCTTMSISAFDCGVNWTGYC